jgi:hypothetical protein
MAIKYKEIKKKLEKTLNENNLNTIIDHKRDSDFFQNPLAKCFKVF